MIEVQVLIVKNKYLTNEHLTNESDLVSLERIDNKKMKKKKQQEVNDSLMYLSPRSTRKKTLATNRYEWISALLCMYLLAFFQRVKAADCKLVYVMTR